MRLPILQVLKVHFLTHHLCSIPCVTRGSPPQRHTSPAAIHIQHTQTGTPGQHTHAQSYPTQQNSCPVHHAIQHRNPLVIDTHAYAHTHISHTIRPISAKPPNTLVSPRAVLTHVEVRAVPPRSPRYTRCCVYVRCTALCTVTFRVCVCPDGTQPPRYLPK